MENKQKEENLKGGKTEKDLNNNNSIEEQEKEGENKMASYMKNGRRYYTTKREALMARRKGDRIYYDAFEGAYYIVRPSSRKKSFWGW